MKRRPIPDQMASGEQLTLFDEHLDDPRFGSKAVCASCGQPLWMHDRVREYADRLPAGAYHYTLECLQ